MRVVSSAQEGVDERGLTHGMASENSFRQSSPHLPPPGEHTPLRSGRGGDGVAISSQALSAGSQAHFFSPSLPPALPTYLPSSLPPYLLSSRSTEERCVCSAGPSGGGRSSPPSRHRGGGGSCTSQGSARVNCTAPSQPSSQPENSPPSYTQPVSLPPKTTPRPPSPRPPSPRPPSPKYDTFHDLHKAKVRSQEEEIESDEEVALPSSLPLSSHCSDPHANPPLSTSSPPLHTALVHT